MKRKNSVVATPSKHKTTPSLAKSIQKLTQYNLDDNIKNAKASKAYNIFNSDDPKRSTRHFSEISPTFKNSGKTHKSNPFRLQPLDSNKDLIGHKTPDVGLLHKKDLRSISPKTIKSSLKTKIISQKNFKKVKFEDIDKEIHAFKLDSITKRTFQSFKVSIRKSPTYFIFKEPKKSPRFTVNDLINY